MGRKDDLRRQIERAEKELSRLEAVPDLDAMRDGTVLVVVITWLGSKPYTYVGLKTARHWYFTGSGPDQATGEQVADWLTSKGRRVLNISVLAEIQVVQEPAVDLGAALLNSIRDLGPVGSMYAFAPDEVINDYESRS